MSTLALDIGGANLKAADGRGWARSVPFALWREPDRLPVMLVELIAAAPACRRLAVTMTGELCDCFRTKAEGVRRILAAVNASAAGRTVSVYQTDGRFATVAEACECPLPAAASNWHALARFAGRFAREGSAVSIDVGSTTTDIVPLKNGIPCAQGRCDADRLLTGELVYSGVGRTPICAVVSTLPWGDRLCPVAAEFFATTADAYVLLGDIPEQPEAPWTADSRPLTTEFARERLARMVCADASIFSESGARQAAEFVRDKQHRQLVAAAQRVARIAGESPQNVVISGAGEYLARRVAVEAWPNCRLVSLADKLGREISMCGPAHALAVLAREGDDE